jgi:hypothetical protein
VEKVDPKSAEELVSQSRKALYGSLPLIATFGMQHRESTLKRILSKVSMSSLESLPKTEAEQSLLLSEVDVDEIIMTFPMMMAALVAVVAQFLVGYNTGVMNPAQSVTFDGQTSTLLWSIAVSSFCLGGPFGAFVGGTLANTNGRRGSEHQ